MVERRFPAMGTEARVVVTDGDARLLDLAEARIECLEDRWSRFREHSELNQLNRASGTPMTVSRDTARLVERCARAWRRTGGAFDPTVHDAMLEHGYDRDFQEVLASESRTYSGCLTPKQAQRGAPGLVGLVVDVQLRLVRLPAGVRLDAGGIGKGLAADMVCAELRAAGAAGACVNLGGDLRVDGHAPDSDRGGRWVVTIEDPFDPSRELARVGIVSGAVATSNRLRRAWHHDSERVHHIVDPRTGRPASGRTVAATVITRSAWWAEAAVKSVLLADDPLAAAGPSSAIAIDEDGGVRATPDLEGVLTCSRR